MMALPNISNRAAVRDNVATKAPFSAQNIRQQSLVCTAGLAVRSVVSAHDGSCLAFHDSGAKRRKICLSQISFPDFGVETVPFRLWSTVHSVVFGCGDHFQVTRIIALQTFHKGNP